MKKRTYLLSALVLIVVYIIYVYKVENITYRNVINRDLDPEVEVIYKDEDDNEDDEIYSLLGCSHCVNNESEMLESLVESAIQKKIDTQRNTKEDSLMKIMNKFLESVEICPFMDYKFDTKMIKSAGIGLKSNQDNFNEDNILILVLKPNCFLSQELYCAINKAIMDNNLSLKVIYVYYSTLGEDTDYIANLSLSIAEVAPEKFEDFNKYINTGNRSMQDLNNFLSNNKIKLSSQLIQANFNKINQIKDSLSELEYEDVPMLIKNGQIFIEDFSYNKIVEIITN